MPSMSRAGSTTRQRNAAALDIAQRYAAWATLAPAGIEKHRGGVLFRVPHRLDMNHLVPVETVEHEGVTMLRLPEEDWRHREGFALTDRGTDLTGALDQANYCIWCHNQGKDSCSKGLQGEGRGFQKERVRRDLGRLPARRKNL